jgi:flagellar motor protein MotB
MRRTSFRRQSGQVDEENPYWVSFADIMSGLLVVFVLAALALILELTQTKMEVNDAIREIAKAEQVRRDILHEVETELKNKNIPVEISDNETVLRIPETLLAFESNEFRIPHSGKVRETVLDIGRVLHIAISKEDRWKSLDTIFVEGHTDNRRSPRQMGNWGLSTFRAISVWNYWDQNLTEDESLENLKNHDNKPLFSVSGYGETRPAQVIQRTEDEFQKNRRIDIRFTVRRPALEELENVRKLIDKNES